MGSKALLTHSCTAALEMAALLIDIGPGDEVIMPSYTFVSTANAFALRGATPIFVDIDPITLNIDARLIEQSISSKTKAIVVVHYAGVGCAMHEVMDIARRHNLFVVEDAAQGIISYIDESPLATIGDIGCFSFHETKNLICGEGGALIINNSSLFDRAEVIREKGTNRSSFFRGQVDKYTWVDIGSSYLPGELNAAFLLAQLQSAHHITSERLQLWNQYDKYLKSHPFYSRYQLPSPPIYTTHNAHIYFIIFDSLPQRTHFIEEMKSLGVQSVFHYVPLHTAPAALNFFKTDINLPVTVNISERLVRLPLYLGLNQELVFTALDEYAQKNLSST